MDVCCLQCCDHRAAEPRARPRLSTAHLAFMALMVLPASVADARDTAISTLIPNGRQGWYSLTVGVVCGRATRRTILTMSCQTFPVRRISNNMRVARTFGLLRFWTYHRHVASSNNAWRRRHVNYLLTLDEGMEGAALRSSARLWIINAARTYQRGLRLKRDENANNNNALLPSCAVGINVCMARASGRIPPPRADAANKHTATSACEHQQTYGPCSLAPLRSQTNAASMLPLTVATSSLQHHVVASTAARLARRCCAPGSIKCDIRLEQSTQPSRHGVMTHLENS